MLTKRGVQKDEALQLFENLDNKNISMDKDFSEKLKSEIQQEFEHENAFDNLINFVKRSLTMPSLKFNKIPVISSLTISLILISFFGLTNYQLLKDSQNSFLKNKKTEVLSKILQNNSGSVLKSAKNPSDLFSVSQAIAAELTNSETKEETAKDITSSVAPMYINDNYNFFHYTNTYKLGPAASQCPAYGDSENFYSKIDTYDYQKYQENSYYPQYKYLAYNKDNKLVDYSLSFDNYRYEYKGGSYALRFEENYDYINVKTDAINMETIESNTNTPLLQDEAGIATGGSGNNVVVGSPESIPEPKDVIPYYFGENSEVKEITQDGKKYYLVTYSYDTPCDYSQKTTMKDPTISSNFRGKSLNENSTKKLVFKDLYEADTYSLIKQEVYLTSINDNNLISSSEYVVEKYQKTPEEVADNFTFDMNVEVKNVPSTNYDENSYYPYEQDATKQTAYLVYLKNFLQDKDINVLVPSDEKYELFETSAGSYYDVTKPYYTDRNFYANNASGQKQYEDYIYLSDSYGYNTEFSTTYTLKDTDEKSSDVGYYSIMTYDKNIDMSNFDEYFFGTGQYTTKENVNLKINNETITGTKYLYTPEIPNGADTNTEDIKSLQKIRSYVITFNYQSNTYMISLSIDDNYDELVNTFLELKAFNPDSNWSGIEQNVNHSFTLHENINGVTEPGAGSSSGSGEGNAETPAVVKPETDIQTMRINP